MARKVDWTEIKEHYVAGKAPSQIARLKCAKSQGLDAKRIGDQASKSGWTALKEEIVRKTQVEKPAPLCRPATLLA
mgnify:CR=1 FL=1